MSLKIVFMKDDEEAIAFDVTGEDWEEYLMTVSQNLGSEAIKKPFLAGVSLLAYDDGGEDMTFSGGSYGRPDLIVQLHAELVAKLAMESKNPKVFCGLICDKALEIVRGELSSRPDLSEGIVIPPKQIALS